MKARKMRSGNRFQIGDRVVVRVCKRSTHPGQRAQHIRPEQSGEGYLYEVEKFWAVSEVRGDELVLLTRRGKVRVVDVTDTTVRRAGWWQRMIYRDRFPDPATPVVGISAGPGNR